MVYTYTNSNTTNQLLKVVDSAPAATKIYGFTDSATNTDDYSYDANGNMTKDNNKNITAITYNHLNLPTKITFATTGNIAYLYNAVGQKVQKIVKEGANETITDYLGGYQYVKTPATTTMLKFFPTAEGYVEVSGSSYKYIYQYKDHLGNIRLSYDKNLVLQDENQYYPFGLLQKRPTDAIVASNYKYKYNGKELQDELGLNFYDYGARNYDPALGRWMNIDPLAEKSRRFSPYTYALDNPVYFIDPDGMLSKSFIDDLIKKSDDNKNTKWTFNDDGSASGSNGATVNSDESTESGQGSESSQGGTPDPPTTSSFWDLMKSIFRMAPRSNEEAHQMEVDRDFFYDSTNLMIEVGDNWLTAMTVIFPMPSNPSTEVKATGWIARKVFSKLDSSVAKKFASAMGKGVVAPTGKQGIIRLTASEAEAVGAGYTHKLKILGKGGDLRIYGKQLPNGQFLFDKLLTH